MKKSHSLIFWIRLRTITVFAGVAILFYSAGACADEEQGRLTRDLTLGPSHDIQLKTDQVVRVLKHSGPKVVIMAQLADGSSGVYQVDATAVASLGPNAAAPSPPIATTPAATNGSPINPTVSVPAASTNAPAPQPAAPAVAPAASANDNKQAGINANDPGQQATAFAADLKGRLVVLEDGQTKSFDPSTLPGVKYWAVYYSASWCPPCQAFTPDLVKFYKEFKPEHQNFELILVCHDKSEDAMLAYMKTDSMTWPALRFSDVWNEKLQVLKYAAAGIPNLVLVDENGKVLSSSYNGTDYVGPEKVMDDIKKLVPVKTL